jgi:hypothetical protein
MNRSASLAGFSFICACVSVAAYAQTPSSPLTPMQKEMLKSPNAHLCGNAVTNVPCDELKSAENSNYASYVAGVRYDPITPGFNGHRLPPAPKLTREGSWTPSGGQFEEIAKAHGWMELTENDQARAWVAYRSSDTDPSKASFALKTVSKQMDGSSAEVDILSGKISCGANGSPPNSIAMASFQTYAWNHAQISADVSPSYGLEPGTLPARVVQEICKRLASRK